MKEMPLPITVIPSLSIFLILSHIDCHRDHPNVFSMNAEGPHMCLLSVKEYHQKKVSFL